jgi:hypothetical protein
MTLSFVVQSLLSLQCLAHRIQNNVLPISKLISCLCKSSCNKSLHGCLSLHSPHHCLLDHLMECWSPLLIPVSLVGSADVATLLYMQPDALVVISSMLIALSVI